MSATGDERAAAAEPFASRAAPATASASCSTSSSAASWTFADHSTWLKVPFGKLHTEHTVPLDAEHAGVATTIPKPADGQVETIHLVKIAPHTAFKAHSPAMIILKAVLVTASAEVRARARAAQQLQAGHRLRRLARRQPRRARRRAFARAYPR